MNSGWALNRTGAIATGGSGSHLDKHLPVPLTRLLQPWWTPCALATGEAGFA